MQMSAPFFAVWRMRFEDRRVINHQHVGIGHEELEAGHALAHHVVHVFEARVAEIGHDHVQAVVDAGLALGLLPPGVERRAHLRAPRLDGEVHNRCGSADGRGSGAGKEVIGGVRAAEGHIEVRVRVDAAGKDKKAGCIDDLFGGTWWDSCAYFLDGCAVDEEIGLHIRVGVYNGSVLD